jgi:S-adenosylmethionine:tRNA ribosyltransferase-isomerase
LREVVLRTTGREGAKKQSKDLRVTAIAAAVKVELFDYELPPERIAQEPAPEREAARLMVLPADGGAPEHTTVASLPDLIPAHALVVLNDTRVVPARLLGVKADTGGRVEIFLVQKMGTRELDGLEHQVWRALGKSSKSLRFGTNVIVGPLVIRLLGRAEEDGLLEVGITTTNGMPVDDAIRETGHVPLPPYIKRDDADADRERYQTVFARADGAIAAPTAGLHLTRAMLGRFAVRGAEVATVTLHVGLGTFQPVTVADLDDHPMHSERYEVSRTAQASIAKARERDASVVAVGTTVVRTLESVADPAREGLVMAGAGATRLLIQPGYRFRVVDVLVTNFHLPKSTLLALVCAFGGTERVLAAYETAVKEKYRFFSYGDAMLLWRAR